MMCDINHSTEFAIIYLLSQTPIRFKLKLYIILIELLINKFFLAKDAAEAPSSTTLTYPKGLWKLLCT
jgi:hypothetical protein